MIPTGVTVKGDNVDWPGRSRRRRPAFTASKDPSTKSRWKAQNLYHRAADASGSGDDDNNGAPTIQEVKPRIYDQLYLILGIAFATLAAGSVALYRSNAAKKN